MNNKYLWAGIGALLILAGGDSLIRGGLFIIMSGVAGISGAVTTLTAPTVKPPETAAPTQHQPSNDIKLVLERMEKAEARQDRRMERLIEALAVRQSPLQPVPTMAPPDNRESRGRWLCAEQPCSRRD